MNGTGRKIEKVQKTKFRKNKEVKENTNSKMKHHDRSFYRLS
jgi:hypothetical protein